jgi:hypothetical protein
MLSVGARPGGAVEDRTIQFNSIIYLFIYLRDGLTAQRSITK